MEGLSVWGSSKPSYDIDGSSTSAAMCRVWLRFGGLGSARALDLGGFRNSCPTAGCRVWSQVQGVGLGLCTRSLPAHFGHAENSQSICCDTSSFDGSRCVERVVPRDSNIP